MSRNRSLSTANAAKGNIVVGTGTDTSAVLAVGTDGQVLTADAASSGGIKWATPTATTWTQRKAGDSNNIYAIAYNGSNLYIAVGITGILYSSADGKTWTSRTSGFGANDIRDIAFGAGIFVAVGQNGTITTSTDGITWTARTSNFSTNQINAITYSNSTFVAVGEGGGTTNTGGIIYSTDGITWTRINQSLTVGTSYKCVIWNGTNWIVGAALSTNNYVYCSTAGGTWTAAKTTIGTGSVLNLIYDGTRTFYVETSTFYYTTNTTITSEVALVIPKAVTAPSLYAVRYYNNKIYVVNGIYTQSFTTASTAYPAMDLTYINPMAYLSTTANTLSNPSPLIWVGAIGTIYFDSIGRIYTSF